MRFLSTIFYRAIVPARAFLAFALLIVAAGFAWSPSGLRSARATSLIVPRTFLGGLSQENPDTDEDEVPPEDVEKYVAVYQAMQHDHTLTAEQAASRNGMTLDAFRQLENRVQRDDAAMEHVRDELKSSAAGASPGSSPSGANSGK